MSARDRCKKLFPTFAEGAAAGDPQAQCTFELMVMAYEAAVTDIALERLIDDIRGLRQPSKYDGALECIMPVAFPSLIRTPTDGRDC